MRLPPLSDTRRGNGAMILSLLIVMAIVSGGTGGNERTTGRGAWGAGVRGGGGGCGESGAQSDAGG